MTTPAFKTITVSAAANSNHIPLTPKTYRLVGTSGSCFNAATTEIVRR